MNEIINEKIQAFNDALEHASLTPNLEHALRSLADLAQACSYNPIREARNTFRNAFREDPSFYQTYVDNVSGLIMDFESARHNEPGTEIGPMTSNERAVLAHKILERLFDL